MSKSDAIDITVQLHAETEKAVLVSDDGDETKAKWVPKSQIEIERKGNGVIEITIPEWMAVEKGFV